MSVSIFQVAGPIMIGPSSSHTAGAARLARIAARLQMILILCILRTPWLLCENRKRARNR